MYDGRVNLVTGLADCVTCGNLEVALRSWLDQPDEDIESLDSGFNLWRNTEKSLQIQALQKKP